MKMRGRSFLLVLTAVCFFIACEQSGTKKEKPIAEVGNKQLFLSDVPKIFPEGSTRADSVSILKDYISSWARQQFLALKADDNLSENEKDVTKELDEYRTSLLIYRYEQAYVEQRLDTTISNNEIEAFYRENAANFMLNTSLVKAVYIKLKKDSPYFDKIRSLYRSNKSEDVVQLDDLCLQVADKYDYFNDQWIDFNRLAKELPLDAPNYERMLSSSRNIEEQDDNFHYLVNIREIKFRGAIAPLEAEIENIRSIILNKRKQTLLKKLEQDIYNEALNSNRLKTYIE